MGEALDPEENEHLARALLGARKVRLRHQFFAWAQGALQALIPHETLLLGVADARGQLRHERFNACRWFRDGHFQRVCEPGTGLLAELRLRWLATRAPLLLADDAPDWGERLRGLELRNLVFHCHPMAGGQGYAYLAFARVRAPFDERLALLAELLAPALLAALAQVIAGEQERAPEAPGYTAAPATPRELEILGWVREGKTNAEIGSILGLSALTVKNHLFRATKKLDVRTRGQAVARVIALGLLSPHAGGRGEDRT
jgi:transcriptional regulator EpsA